MWIPNNPFMARDGVEDSPERAMTYLDALVGDAADAPGTSPERRRTYVDQAPRMIDFLLKQGIRLTRVKRWPDYYDDLPGGSAPGRTVIAELFDLNRLGAWKTKLRPGFLMMPATLPEMMALPTFRRTWAGKRAMARVAVRSVTSRMRRRHYASAGAGLQGWMLDAALKAGAEIRTEMPVSSLVVEDRRVTGIATTRDGRPWRVGARLGVLVNAGGFAHNQAMRDRWQPGTKVEWTQAAPGDTGEMIEEMVRIGAVTAQMEERVGYQTTIPPGAESADVTPPAQALTAAPHAILVDRSGVRYQNEGGSYMAYCKGMMERDKTVPAVPSWAVFDSRFMKSYMLGGTMPGTKKPQRWFDEGYLHKADTVKALARAIGAPPANLVATVQRFNGFVEQGRDEDFRRGERAYDEWLGDPSHKPSRTLGTIAQAPFYAVPVVPGDVSTYGGVVTDTHARVVREDGTPIEGLYATGVSTASVMGRAYPGAGASVGPSFTWGYVAAKHAAGLGNVLP
jgi:3-oxosteroid 1-dehydrogenase